MIHLRADGIGYLLPFAREYHKLHRLSAAVHHVVEHIVFHCHHAETKGHLVGTLDIVAKLREEHTGANDAEINGKEHAAKRDIVIVLIHAGSNDIRTTRRTIVIENSGQGNTCDGTADNHGYELLTLAHQFERQSVRLLWQYILCEFQHQGEHKDSIDSLHQELVAQYFQGYDEQQAVNDQVGILQMETCGIVNNSRKTCHTTCHNLIRHEKDGEGDGVHQQTKGDEHIVLGLVPNDFMLYSHIYWKLSTVNRKLLNHDIHHALWHDDNLYYLLVFYVLSRTLVTTNQSFDRSIVGISSHLNLKAGLTIEGHTHLCLTLYEVLLIPCGPLGVAYTTLLTQHLPQLFCNMGSERCNEDDEVLDHLLVLALLL